MCYRFLSKTEASAESGNNKIQSFLLFKSYLVQLYDIPHLKSKKNIPHLKGEERVFIIKSEAS